MPSHPKTQRIKLWPLARLSAYPRNPRTHSGSQNALIAASMIEFGSNAPPILVDSSKRVIAGNGRRLAAERLGLAEVPVVVLDHLRETKKPANMTARKRACPRRETR
jgi:ParB-like chromosome segregation protein Spo0J